MHLLRLLRWALKLGLLITMIFGLVKVVRGLLDRDRFTPATPSRDWTRRTSSTSPIPEQPPTTHSSSVSAAEAPTNPTAVTTTGRHDEAVADPTQLWAGPEPDGTCPEGYPIKAKRSSGIYHRPGMQAYARTKPDRCYPTPEAAEADGFRVAKR